MHLRDYSLPAGWFPREKASVLAFLKEFNGKERLSKAAISPHAGWYYSGKLAAMAISSLSPDADTVVVLGGHLGGGSPALFAMEDAARTPFGNIEIDKELREILINDFEDANLNCSEDRYRDNTIEVLLPMVHYFFPKAKIIWLRLPAEIESFESGKIIAKAASKSGRDIRVIASTDLTHYGSNYGFSPKGRGENALNWVRDVNDAGFVKAVQAADANEVLRCAEIESAACSPGAVLGALGFADSLGLGNAKLLKYATSADAAEEEPDSFVGYAAMKF